MSECFPSDMFLWIIILFLLFIVALALMVYVLHVVYKNQLEIETKHNILVKRLLEKNII